MGKRKSGDVVEGGYAGVGTAADGDPDFSRIEELETEVEGLHNKVGELQLEIQGLEDCIEELKAEVVETKVAAFDLVQAMFEE